MLDVSTIASHFAEASGNDPLRSAFSSRRAVMPFRGKTPLAPEKLADAWARASALPAAEGPRLLYVHIPFCANHCLFCGFYRNAYTPETGSDYADLVVREIELEAGLRNQSSGLIDAIYFGGGTPSALSAEELSRLITTLRRNLPLAPDCEITVEGRIIHFDADKVDACLEAGANRFSIGVQSFDTQVRRRQGRRSSREEAVAFLEGLKSREKAALVIDLMYGLPGQTPDVWRRDLETAAALAPDGLDLYGLNIIRGTPLFTALQSGKFPATPELGHIGDYYRSGADFFNGLGWRQVSNNHWARTPKERNRYNRLIKEGGDCLAFGSGAGGTLGGLSYTVMGDLEAYRAAVLAGRKPYGMMFTSDALHGLRNVITGELERGRLDLSRLDHAAGAPLSAALEPLFAQWQAAGLLTRKPHLLELTVAGRFWYGNLINAFHELAAATLVPQGEPA